MYLKYIHKLKFYNQNGWNISNEKEYFDSTIEDTYFLNSFTRRRREDILGNVEFYFKIHNLKKFLFDMSKNETNNKDIEHILKMIRNNTIDQIISNVVY